ncbi:MAG: N-acetylneuraminate synthase family protein [Candidatus Paceibacterota bacterium]
MKNPKVVAEIGCNHKGDMEIAHEMIKMAAKFCKVDAVKFQKRNNREYLTEEQYNTPHPNPVFSYGKTYGEHREFLELDLDQHRQLKAWCEDYDIEYGTSVWDVTSAREIASLHPIRIKVPSACNTNFSMLEVLCKEYSGEIHVSFGMTTRKEEEEIIAFFEKQHRNDQVVIYSCTSGYPVAFEDICLYEIARLKNTYGKVVKKVGFSGHHLGIAADIAALTLGAEVIERHFTLDRTWKGTDHSASLEPDGMRRLVRDLRNVSLALTFKKKEILGVEQVQRKKLKNQNL